MNQGGNNRSGIKQRIREEESLLMHDDDILRELQRAGGQEIGTSGLNIFAGYVQEAYTSDLYWPKAYDIYNDMRRRVPSLRSLLNAILMLSHQAKFKFEGFTDSGIDKEAADFGDSLLEDLGPAFNQFQEDAFSALIFGWSWHEVNYSRRVRGWKFRPDDPYVSQFDDGRIGWRSFAYRRQSSWDGWEVDEPSGKLRGFWQKPLQKTRLMIPLEKSLHFVPFRDGDNPEGWALLESSYEPYYYLKNFSIILGVGMERALVGWPVFSFEKRPGKGDHQKIKEAVATLLSGSEKGYLTIPPGVSFDFATVPNLNAPILLDIMKYYNLLILQTVMADFIWLGAGDVGSYALGKDKSQLFIMAINGFLDSFVDAMNTGPVRRIFELNRGNGFEDLEQIPRLTHTGVHKPMAPDDIAEFLSKVAEIVDLNEDDIINFRARSGGLLAEGKKGESGLVKTRPETEPQEVTPTGQVTQPKSADNLSEFQLAYMSLRNTYSEALHFIVVDYLTTPRVWHKKSRGAFLEVIESHMSEAFQIGYRDGGQDEIPDDDLDWISERIEAEKNYATTLWETVWDTKRDPSMITPEIDGYVRSLDAVYGEGKARAAGRKLMLTMVRIRETKEPCATCLRLEGKRHSGQWWTGHGLIPGQPGNRNYICQGYKCGHRLEDDNGNPFIP